jgi:cytochrome bd-type quinol oxidase subunit 2
LSTVDRRWHKIETMQELKVLATFLALVILFWAYIVWAASDARRRGKSALFVCIAVTFFFPFGLIAWLLFRPRISN